MPLISNEVKEKSESWAKKCQKGGNFVGHGLGKAIGFTIEGTLVVVTSGIYMPIAMDLPITKAGAKLSGTVIGGVCYGVGYAVGTVAGKIQKEYTEYQENRENEQQARNHAKNEGVPAKVKIEERTQTPQKHEKQTVTEKIEKKVVSFASKELKFETDKYIRKCINDSLVRQQKGYMRD